MKGLKSVFFGIALIICATPLEARTKKYTGIIAWDLHDVLLQREGTFTTLWQYEGMADIIKHCPLALVKGLLMLLWYNLFTDMSSQAYVNLAYHHANPCLAELVIRVTNAQKLMPGMIEIVKELNALGYEQHILSNIGIDAFKALTDPEQYPQFRELFSYMNLKKSHVVGNDGIHKPDPAYYHAYLAHNHLTLRKQPIIFIDDKKINLETAHDLGFITIHFKNPDQLRGSLQKLSIPLPRPSYDRRTILNPIPRPLTMGKPISCKIQIYSRTKNY